MECLFLLLILTLGMTFESEAKPVPSQTGDTYKISLKGSIQKNVRVGTDLNPTTHAWRLTADEHKFLTNVGSIHSDLRFATEPNPTTQAWRHVADAHQSMTNYASIYIVTFIVCFCCAMSALATLSRMVELKGTCCYGNADPEDGRKPATSQGVLATVHKYSVWFSAMCAPELPWFSILADVLLMTSLVSAFILVDTVVFHERVEDMKAPKMAQIPFGACFMFSCLVCVPHFMLHWLLASHGIKYEVQAQSPATSEEEIRKINIDTETFLSMVYKKMSPGTSAANSLTALAGNEKAKSLVSTESEPCEVGRYGSPLDDAAADEKSKGLLKRLKSLLHTSDIDLIQVDNQMQVSSVTNKGLARRINSLLHTEGLTIGVDDLIHAAEDTPVNTTERTHHDDSQAAYLREKKPDTNPQSAPRTHQQLQEMNGNTKTIINELLERVATKVVQSGTYDMLVLGEDCFPSSCCEANVVQASYFTIKGLFSRGVRMIDEAARHVEHPSTVPSDQLRQLRDNVMNSSTDDHVQMVTLLVKDLTQSTLEVSLAEVADILYSLMFMGPHSHIHSSIDQKETISLLENLADGAGKLNGWHPDDITNLIEAFKRLRSLVGALVAKKLTEGRRDEAMHGDEYSADAVTTPEPSEQQGEQTKKATAAFPTYKAVDLPLQDKSTSKASATWLTCLAIVLCLMEISINLYISLVMSETFSPAMTKVWGLTWSLTVLLCLLVELSILLIFAIIKML